MPEETPWYLNTPGQRLDPVAGFRFGIEIQGLVVGWFTECGGISIERTVTPHEEGGINDYVHQLPGRIKQAKITLKRGIADETLWDWFQKGLYDGKVDKRNISIILYNVDRSQAKRWDLNGAYPVKWTGPELKVDGNQVSIESLELVHHGLTMTKWTDV